MPLPQIPNSGDAVVVPPTSGKTYGDWFVTRINITADATGNRPMRAQVIASAYDYASGEVAPGSSDKVLTLTDLEAMAVARATAGKPALAEAMGAIIAAVTELLNE